MKKLVSKMSGILAILVMASSCTTDTPDVSRDVEINNDEAMLSTRMLERNETITIVTDGSGKKVKDIKLTLVGELIPPKVNGELLQATSIARKSSFMAVSYNFSGDTYHGGIDLIDDKLKLKSEIQFKDADVNDVTILGNAAYFVGGTSSLPDPAFVEKVSIKGGKFSLDNSKRVNVGSYTGNSIMSTGSEIFVTSGNDEETGGGLYRFNDSLDQMNYESIKDARWAVEWKKDVYCLSGSPSMVKYYDSNLTAKGEFSHKALSHAEAKLTIDIDKDMVFVAGGSEGLLIYNLEGELIVQHTFDDSSITNAVTAENGNVFISNGEGGVYVASYDDDEITVIGKLALDSNESVNHILLRSNKLFVASGLGGVKMINVK